MKYGLITSGSRGDVQPFITLALAMMERGHAITLVAPENFRDLVEGFGIAYLPITGDSEQIIGSPEALRLLEGGSVFRFFYHLQKVSARSAHRSNQDILEACRHFDALIVSILPLPIVYSIAEKYHKKCAVVFLSMPPIPTGAFPFQAISIKGPSWFNRLTYKLLGLGYAMIRKKVDQFRKEIGLPSVNVMKACLRSDMLALVTLSRYLIKRPDDWPSNAHVTGFFYLPPSERKASGHDKIPEGLEAWLAKGDKPVYIGFGSIPVPDLSRLYKALEGVLSRKRVVLCTGWSVLNGLPVHPGLFVAKYADHDWLLPRCAVAVIHGGIGTIAAALRSGTPIIVVSILADQPVNGKMVEQKKLGYHLPFKRLTPERLLRAIIDAESAEVVGQCKTMAANIAAEDGLREAVGFIEKYFERSEEGYEPLKS